MSNTHLIQFCLVLILILAAAIDVKYQKIPNWLTFPAIVSVMIYHGINSGSQGLLFGVAGLLTGVALFIVPYLMGGMGAGDVKLMGVIGATLGWQATLYAMVYIAVIGGVYGLALLLYHKQSLNIFKRIWMDLNIAMAVGPLMAHTPERTGAKAGIRYGVAIALGTIVYLAVDKYAWGIV